MPSSPSPTALRCHVYRFRLALFTLALAACVGKDAPSDSSGQIPPPAAAEQAVNTVNIGTAGVTGVYYQAGSGICRTFNRNRGQQGVNCSADSTEGSSSRATCSSTPIRATVRSPKWAPIATCAPCSRSTPSH